MMRPSHPAGLTLKAGTAWDETYARCLRAAPEAFDEDRARNLWAGAWQRDGVPQPAVSPVDGTDLPGPPFLDDAEAHRAVAAAYDQHQRWRRVPLAERRARVTAALDAMTEHRDLLALLLVWEIGKPWRLACADVDRCIEGVRWYVDAAPGHLEGRVALDAPVTNIASWNYPMSVLMHAMLVQVLAGNATVAKVPTNGGLSCLTLAAALGAREGLPLTLISGSGARLNDALVRSPHVGCVSFVGGRRAGARIAAALSGLDRRHILEQEGLNTWGVWEYSDWDLLGGQLRKTYEYAKQRCTAYPRFVVQRSLLDRFLAAYLGAVREIRFGHPLAVAAPEDPFPELDFGPLINNAKAKELAGLTEDTIAAGGLPLYRGSLDDGRFLPGQDTSAYLAPAAILAPPPSSPLHHAEPFGPVDTIVVVDTEAELLSSMNASNGALVATLSCDDESTAGRLAQEIRAFKVGINKPRSRGDREERFGGHGNSWRGAVVGGELLTRAVTRGPREERLPGNYPDYLLLPS
ncbi:aldehyde dehydrogenase family protein [Streptomyces sp. DSM 44917]|uniref:Aldehyde dehydrogenase family protein n=1 Tax=Streptomyces boetiae TaxID=3075541 RepID=A0ABU2LE41_9ACTN|nr:aldehyde dehydrogenase family protein [Streptomyces sp. DSM 44917]MDT0309538.1 aldehyde dehydrogenase family protein [Streptomyces sp. DSM 44917]